MLARPMRYCSLGERDSNSAANSPKRPRSNAMRRSSGGWPVSKSVAMASMAMRRERSSPRSRSAEWIEVISLRMAKSGELASRNKV